MIFKAKDPIEGQLCELELALKKPLPDRDRRRLEKELAQRRAGLKGEEEAAYHINFHLGNHPNWAVIHDLRIEWKGRTAQMDHLLISRMLEIYVVESKSFRTKVRYANGGWERLNFNHWEGIPCPVAQNERHIAVLKELISDLKLAPTRLGMSMRPTFYNIVVVQPSCSIIGKYTGDARIWRLDTLVKKVRDDDPAVMDVLKIISQDTLHLFATKMAAYHKAASAAKVSLPSPHPGAPEAFPAQSMPGVLCHACKGPLSAAEVRYCRQNEARFGGDLLCRKCQGYAPKAAPANVLLMHDAPGRVEKRGVSRCEVCGATVDQKVVCFCRFNSKRFAGRLLCRACQPAASKSVATAIRA